MSSIVTGAASGHRPRGRARPRRTRRAPRRSPTSTPTGSTETAASLGESVSVAGDLTDPARSWRSSHGAVRAYGGLDAVVFNAGIAPTGELGRLSTRPSGGAASTST